MGLKLYKIIDQNGAELDSFITLGEAMSYAKTLGTFVRIQGTDFEVCGLFGVDSVRNGKCPDGVAYDWNKASRIGRVRRERVV